jgi:CBS domain-containing protein
MIKNCMKKNVISISESATILEAATLIVNRHIGLIPVVNKNKELVGTIGLHDLLSLEMPAFFNLINDLDFVGDFGAVETTRPLFSEVSRPINAIMQAPRAISEDDGMLYAYALMMKHNLSDLPVVTASGQLVGVVSKVDIGAEILAGWKEIKESLE